MIIFNFVGLAMLIGCGVIGYAGGNLFGDTSENFMLIVGAPLLLTLDLWYRRTRQVGPAWNVASAEDAKRWWYHPKRGGQLMFIPVWIWGLIWMVTGTFGLLFK